MRLEHDVFSRLEPEPLAPEQIVGGTPVTADLTLATGRAEETAGLWSCTPGSFSDVEVRESFLVLSGRATLRYEDGTEHELGPGVVHEFAGGERTVWTVHEKLTKAYWIAAPMRPESRCKS